MDACALLTQEGEGQRACIEQSAHPWLSAPQEQQPLHPDEAHSSAWPPPLAPGAREGGPRAVGSQKCQGCGKSKEEAPSPTKTTGCSPAEQQP